MKLKATNLHKRALPFIALVTALNIFMPSSHAQTEGVVNLYTTREPKLIQPLLEDFTKVSGIKVNIAYFKDGMGERVKAEGANSPADILMTVDIGNLIDLVEMGITQPLSSKVLDSAIPAGLRDPNGHWYVLSLRDRVLYASKDLNIKNFNYEDLANPQWKGKVCIRSGQHPYNIGLIAAMISHNGEAATEQWLRGVKKNLARKATGGDRDVARDILGGLCDIGLANAYYAGQMKSAAPGTDARKWGNAINVIRPVFKNTDTTFVNISGAGLAKASPNKNNAIKLIEYLVSDDAQKAYAKINYEYPVKPGVSVDPMMESFGPLRPDTLSIATIAKNRQLASQLVDKVGFDQ